MHVNFSETNKYIVLTNGNYGDQAFSRNTRVSLLAVDGQLPQWNSKHDVM